MSYTSGIFLKGSPSPRVGLLLLFGYIGKKAGRIKNNNIYIQKELLS
jgi:hypothetical protein